MKKTNKVCYVMSSKNKPAIFVNQNERFSFFTKDCYSNNLRTEKDVFTKKMWPTVNPATGPVYIKGAKPGNILKVDIKKIKTRNFAVMCVEKGAGALADKIKGVETKIIPIKNNKLLLNKKVSIEINPMIGVIGTAPLGKGIPTGTPGEHGGNMDCKNITQGVSLYLPINVKGALLSLGDIHAVMGDGEVCICGAEVSGEVILKAKAIRSKIPTPCVETADEMIFIGSAKNLDDCEKIVLDKAHKFLVKCLKIKSNDAARIMSLTGNLGVCQVVDPLKTMKFSLPKNILIKLGLKGVLRQLLETSIRK